jgi:histidinol-phosphate aminotransferase
MFDINKIVRDNIRTLNTYSSARDEFTGAEGVFLDANENPYGSLNRYPDPYQKELKELLAQRIGVSTDKLFVGNGSDEVLDLVFRVFCSPGLDKALTFAPTYGMYKVLGDINDIELIEKSLNSNFELELESIEDNLRDDQLKLILICSPNNPTGNTVDLAVLQTILEKFNGIVVVDEAYIEFAEEKSALGLIDEYPNLIVTRTMSKAWGLAGARIGYALADPSIIAYLNKVKPPYNVSSLNQQAAIEALLNEDKYNTNMQEIREEKTQLIDALIDLPNVIKLYPSETNFILAEVDDADTIYNSLVENKIIVRNRNKQVKNCLRITVGTKEENQQLIESLKKIS